MATMRTGDVLRLREDILLLFELVALATADPLAAIPQRTFYDRDRGMLAFEGRALSLLRSLQQRIAGRSRAESGRSEGVVEAQIVAACWRMQETGDGDEAADWLLSGLDAPFRKWTIGQPLSRLYIDRPRLRVGRAVYEMQTPGRLLRSFSSLGAEFQWQSCVHADVWARDEATARVLALEAFADAGALMDLLDPPKLGTQGAFVSRADDGSGRAGFGTTGWIIGSQAFTEKHRLVPPYDHLSRLLRKEETKRADWDRRVIAAMRWLSRARRSVVAADRLVSLMVALEALFIEGRQEQAKGKLLATRVTERIRISVLTSSAQEAWLADLYQRRNDAVHEGREYTNDFEVEDLADLTDYTVRFAAQHLLRDHAKGLRRPCRTFGQAMRCPSWVSR
jgi:hypothetical protein